MIDIRWEVVTKLVYAVGSGSESGHSLVLVVFAQNTQDNGNLPRTVIDAPVSVGVVSDNTSNSPDTFDAED